MTRGKTTQNFSTCYCCFRGNIYMKISIENFDGQDGNWRWEFSLTTLNGRFGRGGPKSRLRHHTWASFFCNLDEITSSLDFIWFISIVFLMISYETCSKLPQLYLAKVYIAIRHPYHVCLCQYFMFEFFKKNWIFSISITTAANTVQR